MYYLKSADRLILSLMISDLCYLKVYNRKTQRHEPYDFATQMIPAVDLKHLKI